MPPFMRTQRGLKRAAGVLRRDRQGGSLSEGRSAADGRFRPRPSGLSGWPALIVAIFRRGKPRLQNGASIANQPESLSTQEGGHQPAKPWYRHFWVWVVILLPASSVVGGITTVIIAFNNADERVVDDWYKDGRAINKGLEQEKRADELGLSATLDNRDGRAVLLFDRQDSVSAPALKLALRHPTQSKRDQVLRLVREAPGRYSAPVGLPTGRWVASLEPERGDWRIRQRLDLQRDSPTTVKAAPW